MLKRWGNKHILKIRDMNFNFAVWGKSTLECDLNFIPGNARCATKSTKRSAKKMWKCMFGTIAARKVSHWLHNWLHVNDYINDYIFQEVFLPYSNQSSRRWLRLVDRWRSFPRVQMFLRPRNKKMFPLYSKSTVHLGAAKGSGTHRIKLNFGQQ